MQVAGAACQQCGEKIMTRNDGTWCPKCTAPYHKECIAEGSSCDRCSTPWTPPEQSFFFSDVCPVCARPNSPPSQNCGHCGTITHWDTQNAYVLRCAQVRSWGKKQMVLGVVMIGLSTTLAVFLFGIATIALSFIAIPAGVMRVRAGLRASQFR